MEHQTGKLRLADGMELFTQAWLPRKGTKATVVVVHGYAEHSGRYAHVAEYLVEQGYAVHGMDLRGHGQSRGQQFGYFNRFDTLLEDLTRFVGQVRATTNTGPMFMLGHSLGGTLALLYGLHYQSTLKGLIISAPYLDPGLYAPALVRISVSLLSQIVPKLGTVVLNSANLSKDSAVVHAYDNDPNVFRGRIPMRVAGELVAGVRELQSLIHKVTLPVLCLHGSDDKIADPGCTQFVYSHIGSPDKTMKVYDGLYHEILNEPERTRVLADIWVWLASHHGTGELRRMSARQ